VFSEQVVSTHDSWLNHPHTHAFSPHSARAKTGLSSNFNFESSRARSKYTVNKNA
jgi:hypothetical protein